MTREEAIDKVRVMKLSPGKDAELIIALHTLIPELRESEDERIRKELIGMVKFHCADEHLDRYLNWLEKQKEQKHYWKPTETDVALFNKAVTTNKALTPTERAQLDIIRSKFGCCCAVNCSGIVQKEQKPEERFEEAREKYQVEWSEEDENMFNDILLDMADRREMFKSKGETTFAENTQRKIDWLDSHHLQLKYQSSCPQPKQEWSEEEKKFLQVAISCTYDRGYLSVSNWLKSLCPSWKPSEEQMKHLYYALTPCSAFDLNILNELYEQLKKL